jgi:hypothetical protein
VVGFCNIGLTRTGGPYDAPYPFAQEARDFQVALATRIGGHLRHSPDSSRGGFFDRLESFQLWTPDFAIGSVEPAAGETFGDADGQLRLLMTAGRRTSELAEERSGLLTGWHNRSRVWRVETDGPIGTLLSMGICELGGVIRGERSACLEIFEAIDGPAQVVHVPDSPLVPNARVVAEQIRRTPAERAAIAHDIAEGLAGGAVTPDPADWMLAGALLGALQRSPATDRYDILTREGLREAGPPDAILLSVNAEASRFLRHRRLGYSLHCHDYRMADAGPAFPPWLLANFEPVRRGLDDIRADYRALIDLIRADAPSTQILICNAMSTSGYEDVQSYEGFDAPMSQVLSSVRDKDMNLMLHDLARERDIAIVDADAIAAELGGQRCLPDGVHQNGEMQAQLRGEILRILRARGVPGFSTTPVR